jgi:hypothetical protein
MAALFDTDEFRLGVQELQEFRSYRIERYAVGGKFPDGIGSDGASPY